MAKIYGTVFILLFALLPSWNMPGPAGSLPPAGQAERRASLLDLLPQSTVMAVELGEIGSRRTEIRGVETIARIQDLLLAGSGLDADTVLRLAGDGAVLALVNDDGIGDVIPVALMNPPDIAETESYFKGAGWWTTRSDGDVLWLGPPFSAELIEELATGKGILRGGTISDQLDELFLPPGGLVRGRINGDELAGLLRSRVPGAATARVISALVAAELDAVRYAGFRRDLVDGELVTEAVVAYDISMLPPEVVGALDGSSSSPPFPSALPPKAVLGGSFRPEAEALLPWLRFAAGAERGGPLRNLDFWIEEIEDRTGRDLQGDLFEALGEHGWFFVTDDDDTDTVQVVALLEVAENGALEETVVDLMDWIGVHTAGRTLGLMIPRLHDVSYGGVRIHALEISTVAGDFQGPAFAVVDRHLILGNGEEAVKNGLDILATRDVWKVPGTVGESGTPPHGSLMVDGHALARLAASILVSEDAVREYGRGEALIELIAGIEDVSADMWYEGDRIRIRSTVRFVDR